jgi:predicted DNA-binding transcriptional regulator AlpA
LTHEATCGNVRFPTHKKEEQSMSLLTKEEVASLLKLSDSAFRSLRDRSPDFPKPIKLSPKVFRWDETDISEWLASSREE